MKKEEKEKKERFDKPGFDARLSFNRQVERYLMGIQSAMLNRDFDAWNINLFGLWSLFNPFISPTDSKEINVLLDRASNFLNVNGNNKSFFHGKGLKCLKEANSKLLFAGKHLLMPVGEEGIDEFDEEQFLRLANQR